MSKFCPETCGVCKKACVDQDDNCPGWTAGGECYKNPGFLCASLPFLTSLYPYCCTALSHHAHCLVAYHLPCLADKTCPKSCGVCGEHVDLHPPCADSNTTQCHIWADSGECENNPLSVIKECPETCGACTVACHDHDTSCKAWASDKKCDSDSAFMLRVCPASCGICQSLEAKEEL